MATITWTDSVGAGSLASDWPAVIRRFTSYRALPSVKQQSAEALTGVASSWVFADCYDATLVLEDILNADQAAVMRFVRHAAAFKPFGVATNDAAARTYPTCQIVGEENAPRAEQDPVELRWRITLPRFRNIAASPVEMLAIYA